MSPRRSDHLFIPTTGMSGVWPLRILTTIGQSFLLIFCTDRIVTDGANRADEYLRIHQSFQQTARCITASLPAREAALHSTLGPL